MERRGSFHAVDLTPRGRRTHVDVIWQRSSSGSSTHRRNECSPFLLALNVPRRIGRVVCASGLF